MHKLGSIWSSSEEIIGLNPFDCNFLSSNSMNLSTIYYGKTRSSLCTSKYQTVLHAFLNGFIVEYGKVIFVCLLLLYFRLQTFLKVISVLFCFYFKIMEFCQLKKFSFGFHFVGKARIIRSPSLLACLLTVSRLNKF